MGTTACKPKKPFQKAYEADKQAPEAGEKHPEKRVLKHMVSSVDPRCREAIDKHFPGACRADVVLKTTQSVFRRYGFNDENTLFASSTCPDEINCIIDDFSATWGENFSLGGLAGLPFTGKTGFHAFSHHKPEKDGRLLIFFAPHIGITSDGKTGRINRLGISKITTACGSCIAAQNAALESLKCTKNGGKKCHPCKESIGDKQQLVVSEIVSNFIEQNMASLMKIEGDLNVETTKHLYKRIKEEILRIIPDDFKAPIGLIGGILINTDYADRQHDYILVNDILIRKKNGTQFESLNSELKSALKEPRFLRLFRNLDAA
mmetsp:Transcript_10840/g.26528  ORF Transcript_10840/g.26528 Transcript_10840/m.26528 type:complete len:319 (-) Transcript_10840:383-1339(-)|eukprot:CAMPEP_0114499742 /NCGR_PEP_ID=MMETSP0109-20121206/7586_1 /TAXON_ID=29199 /ORGANISM="Chlorarachnion reptans, Strain CCCM449" /LENGTH=318 /DNA_ID=CAMNT_0001677343 /DNA_START=334 /DNA_END=1290 /DNA_ORIENTATION=-